MFIVRNLIIKNTRRRYIYTQWKEGGREQDSGETERERVCVRGCVSIQIVVASIIKMAVGRTDHFGIS
jgi:hypothetical protein